MRDLFITLNVMISMPVIFMRPYVGVIVWCLLSYMNPHRLAWGFAYDMPFAMMIALVTIFAFIISTEPKRIPLNAISVLIIMITVWVCITTIFAIVPDAAFRKWDRTIKILLMTFVTMALVTNRERLQALIWIIVISLGFYGVRGGIFAILTGGNYMVRGPASSFIEDNNQLAFSVLVIMPLIYYLRVTTENKWLRRGLLIALGLSALAVFASYSRGAFVAAAAMSFLLILRSRHKVLIFAGFSLLVVVGASLAPTHWLERMYSIQDYEESASVSGRFDAWKYAFEVAKRRPVFGGGFHVNYDTERFMRYVPEAAKARSFHSIYFEVLGEHGFVGFTMFMILALVALYYCRWVRVRTKHRSDLRWAHELSKMMFLTFAGYAVGGAFLNLAFYDLLYHLLVIIMMTKILVARSLAEPTEQPAAAGARTPAMGQSSDQGLVPSRS